MYDLPARDVSADKPFNAFALPLLGWLLFLVGWSLFGLLLCFIGYRKARGRVAGTYNYMIGTFVGEIVWFVAVVPGLVLYTAAGETTLSMIPLSIIGTAACLWHVARCLKAIVSIILDRPIVDPATWWI